MADLKLLNITLVGLGGAAGAIARLLLTHYLRPHTPATFPWPTFAVNITGCFLIGLLTTLLATRAPHHASLATHALGIGFLGAYTTFSTFELETHTLATAGRPTHALLYLLLSVTTGYLALKLGLHAAPGPRP